MTEWPGDITIIVRANGTVRMEVMPGPLRISRAVLDSADPRWLSRDGDVVSFHSIENDGTLRSYAYTIVGSDALGPEGGWIRCEPLVVLGLTS